MGVLQSVWESYGPESADVSAQMLDAPRNTVGPSMGTARMLRSKRKVPPETASVSQDVFKLLLRSEPRVASAIFARTTFARKWQRWYTSSGPNFARDVGKRVERRKYVRPVVAA